MTFKFKENQSISADSVSDVPTELQSFYTKADDGALTLKPDMAAAADAWDGMAVSNEKVRADLKVAKKGKVDMSPLDDFGSTPAEILATFTSRTKEMSDVIESKKDAVNPDKMRKQMTEVFDTKEVGYNAQIESLQSQLHGLLVTNDLHKAVSLHKGDTHILLPILEKQVKVQDIDGKRVPMVIDEDGEPMRGGTGQLMTMNELVENHKKDPLYKKLFDAEVKKGSGPPVNRVPGSVQPTGAPTKAADDIAAGLAEL